MRNKKSKNRMATCLFLLVFMFSVLVSTSLFTSLFTSNYNNFDNEDLETSNINTLFNGKSYPFELNDVYDDENYTKIYTSAYLQTEYNLNGTVFEDEVSVVNNTNYKSPSNTDVSMIDGTFDDTDNMRANDDSNTEFTPTKYLREYPGMYSFTDVDNGDPPLGDEWVITSTGNGDAYVEADIDGHTKVLKMHDPDGSSSIMVKLYWAGQTSGTIEFWVRVTNRFAKLKMRLMADSDDGVIWTILHNNGYWSWYDGVYHDVRIALSDRWYHFRFDFECGDGGYMGLPADTLDWYINEDLEVNNHPLGADRSEITAYWWWSDPALTGHHYIDAIGYSWDPEYNVGDNLNEYIEPAELNFTMDLNFNEVDTSKLLALDVSSHHYTNVSQTIVGNVYDYDSGTYTEMFSSDNMAETENYFVDESSVDDYIDGSGNLRLQFEGSNVDNDFLLSIDYIKVSFYYKMDVIIYKTFYINGIWQYRFKLIGSLHYTDWTAFEVIDPPSNFYAISESDLTTRWILQNASLSSVEDFHDDINTDYWNLVDVSEDYFVKVANDYLLDNSSVTDVFVYSGTNFDMGAQDTSPCGITWDGTNFWVLGDFSDEAYQYTSAGVYTGTHFDVRAQDSKPSGITWDGTNFWVVSWGNDEVYQYTSAGVYTGVHFDVGSEDGVPDDIVWDGTYFWMVGAINDEVYKYTDAGVYTGTHFNIGGQVTAPTGIAWDGTYLWVGGWNSDRVYKYNTTGTYMGTNFYVRPQDGILKGFTYDGTNFWVVGAEYDEVYEYEPEYNISKNYFGSGYTYMQIDTTELISLKSIDYTTHYNLSSGNYFEVDFQTSSDSKIELILLKDGGVNKTLTLSQSGNTNFDRHTAQISVDEFVEFDQLKISSTFEDEDYVKVYDIKTFKYTITGDSANFLVGSEGNREIYLTPDVYNLRIEDYSSGLNLVNENITIPATGVLDYVYTPIATKQCRIAFFNPQDIPLTFTDYHVYVNRSLGGSYNPFTLLENIFSVDVDTTVYIEIKDRFNTLIRTYEKEITPTTDYLDIKLEVHSLQIKNLMEQQTTVYINVTHIYPLLSGDSLYFMLSEADYQIGFYDEYDLYKNFTIHLISNQAYQLNSSLKTIYFSMFTYDGLGIDHDLVRFYINGERKDFGFNSMLEDSLELVILDFFNNTLANETIDANAYSEYNLFVEIYSMIILNQFTYEDILVNITQVGSGIWMAQIIPKQFGLTYRFLPNVEYNITIYFTNATLYTSRIVNLTTNSHIESFGVPTQPEEYPKDVYFGVYTTTGLGINPYLLRFYIDDVRTDFGFNRIEDQIVGLVVKDYFNTTLFNQNVNTSGIYEYNILITLYSLKVKNEARIATNYTLKLGGLETTGFILPDEIIEYQLATNNYVFDYTNNEDGSSGTININLNQDRVYILNSTYYNIYFSLFDLNLHVIDPNQYVFRLNSTREAFGFIEDLQTDDYTITIVDRFGTSLFNDVVSLRGLNEYVINITLYELQIRHLASENSDLILTEDISGNDYTFIMTPDSIKSIVVGSADYTLNWTNGENAQITLISIALTEDRVAMLNSTYYDVYFSLYDQNGVRLDDSLFSLYLNGTRKDFGFVNLESINVLIVVQDRLNFTAFNNVVTLSSFVEYNIIITVYELQIRHLAQENSNLTLYETTTHNCINFSMSPDYLNKYMLSGSTYNITWTNGENGVSTTYYISLSSDYILTLDSTYYDIFFSLYDLNLHSIDPNLYEFRLNGTIQDFGLIVDLQTDDYTITITDRFENSLFNSIITLRGLNEYRINISLYELQIRHLSRENGNLTLSETTMHNSLDFNMAPDSLTSFILGSSTYNITWLNNENGITTTYDVNLINDYILTLNSTYYDIYFSLFDVNLHVIDASQYKFMLNDTIYDFGQVVDLQTDEYTITVTDRFGTSLFNSIVNLRGLNEYRIDITLFELQIRHLARENGNLTLSETTGHSYLDFNMAPDSLRSFILGSSTYNVTWLNNENGITTTYDINLNSDYILTLNSTYYDIYFSLFDVNLHVIDASQYEFRLNDTIHDFGLIIDLQTDDYSITVVDRFGTSLFNGIITLRGLNEYRIDISLFELQIRHLASENSDLVLTEDVLGVNYLFIMTPDSIKSIIIGTGDYTLNWTNGENGFTTSIPIVLTTDRVVMLNTSYYDVYFSLFDLNLHTIDLNQYTFKLNGTIQDFGLITDLQTDDYAITVTDRFGTYLFNNVVSLRGLNEYRIDITLFELQIRHLARENGNLTLSETTGHSYLDFNMAPDSLRSFILGSSTYNVTWLNNENGITTTYDINLISDYILTLNTSYYDVYFSLFDLNLHSVDLNQYEFRLNGTIHDFGLIIDLQTDDYTITVVDRFGTSLFNGIITLRGLNEYRIDISLFELQIRHLASENSDLVLTEDVLGVNYLFIMTPDSIKSIIIGTGDYTLNWTNGENGFTTSIPIVLTTDRVVMLNTTYHDVYFSVFTYDGLGIDHDLIRFYINGERKDFGLNTIQSETAYLVVLDFFNNTLANETIDASAYSEYNLFVEIYSMIILNQFTYEDILVNITQVGSGIWMAQIIPKQFGLTYRFLPNIEYNITVYFTNAMLYSSRIVNLTDNSHIESFGVPTLPLEYPKNVYFGVYTTTGLGIDPYLLRFYIDGNRTDFGFNMIENMIVTLVVKDYFNSTLFNQNVNTSGIYEYNILITLYSLKVKNEARIATNYTLKLGGLEMTGYILPDEIIEYQLATNNYVFDYTNNEDGSFGTISINLNQDRFYILNSTYYDIYFSLFDLNLHIIDVLEYDFRLNGTIQDLGFIMDLQTDDYNITIVDRFGTSLFNSIVNLRGLNEYRINIYLYELQIRHLAEENSNLILAENVLGANYSFIMAPDSIKSLVIGSANYTLNWINGETGLLTSFSINLIGDDVIKLNSTYYEVYIGLYNFYGIVNLEEVKFYINNTRTDFGFNTIKSKYVDLLVLDYFNSVLYNKTVKLEGLREYSVFISAYTLVVNNLYNTQPITIKITRGNITIERLIGAQGWTEFKLFANITYEITSYVNGTMDEEKSIYLDEEYKTVDFGFYEADVPIVPRPLEADFITVVAFALIVAVTSIIIVISWAYMKKDRDIVPEDTRLRHKRKRKASVDRRKGFYDHT